MYVALAAIIICFAAFMLFCMFHVPLAYVFGWEVLAGTGSPCIVGWVWVVCVIGAMIHLHMGDRLKARHERKLSILEQRIKDGKEGVCTIVEVA